MALSISYGRSSEAWLGYEEFLTALIEKHNIKTICEVGGGANPLLIDSRCVKEKGIKYSILDISKSELDKAPNNCEKILADISSPDFSINKKYDLVFSKMLAEHVSDAKQFHRNVLKILSSEGLAVHFFPTLYTLPFLVNYLVPEFISDFLLSIISPRDRHQHGKFPAYYHWCRGPINSQLKKFKDIGYDIIEYRGFFGHEGYYIRIKPLEILHKLKTNYLLSNPKPLFTSFAYIVMRPAPQHNE